MSRGVPVLPLLLGAGAFALFVGTAARTITFWDGSHYPLLAATLSISNPPGSLLLTLLGWLWTRVVWCPPLAFQLNVLSALFAGITVALSAQLARGASEPAGERRDAAGLAGVAAGGWLAAAFHVWTYATQFTPYGLTALFTALLLGLFVRWFDRAGEKGDPWGLALLACVLGLDVSVHRTNQLLMPALIAGVLLRRPRLLREPRVLGLAAVAYAAGVGSQAGYLVLSARRPFLEVSGLDSLADVWRFIRLDDLGGGFLVNVWPRRAAFFQVQVMDWLAFLWRNMGVTPLTRVAALVLVLAGLVPLARRSGRLAVFLCLAFLSAGLGAVIFFNRPAQYMRPLDRHYLPSLVVMSVFVGAGAAGLASAFRGRGPVPVRLLPAIAIVVLVVADVRGNFVACDRSHTRYAETWARDLLEPLPLHAILFTNGDNDTFPLMALQQIERVRTDVLLLNLPLLASPHYVHSLGEREPWLRGVRASEHAIRDVVGANAGRRPVCAAVTVDPSWGADLFAHARLEGLVNRIDDPGDSTASGAALERFVHERLARVGVTDQRQLIEPEMRLMFTNYGYVGLQLAARQVRDGELQRGLDTLERLDRALPVERLGEPGTRLHASVAEMRERIEDSLRVRPTPAFGRDGGR